jgi:hypothetical protein
MVFKFLLRLSSLEEEVPKPDLSQVSLIFIRGVDFLHSIEQFCLEMESFPYFGEPAPPQLLAPKVPLNKGLVLEMELVLSPFESGCVLVVLTLLNFSPCFLVLLSHIPVSSFILRLGFSLIG